MPGRRAAACEELRVKEAEVSSALWSSVFFAI